MDNLNELSMLWQKGISPEKSLKSIDFNQSGIIDKLRKLGKKHLRINILKTTGIIICSFLIVFTILGIPNITLLTKIALGWIIVSLTATMIIYWKKQYNPSLLNFAENNMVFIENTIKKLNGQKQIITHLLPSLLINLLIGLNLIYLDLLQGTDFPIRVSMHLFMSGFLALAMFLGLKVRKQRFRKDFKPLIEELEIMKQKFENEA